MSFRLSYFTATLLGLLAGCSSGPAPAAAPAPSPERAPATHPAPAERPASATPTRAANTPARDKPVRAAFRGASVEQVMTQFLAHEGAAGADARHVVERIDLNNDRQDDALVLLQSRRYCNARGCTLLVFERVGDAYQLHSRLLLGRTPLIAAESRTGGWRDLVAPMTSATAGMRLMMMKHTARGYPDDPAQLAVVPATREVRGRVLFSDD
ncbi:MAG TPA: hypothetical protein VFT04_05555 [Gemmatimonadales bacterium]|nr:hypothetical protein [Gemmatimonadales bacterium]